MRKFPNLIDRKLVIKKLIFYFTIIHRYLLIFNSYIMLQMICVANTKRISSQPCIIFN